MVIKVNFYISVVILMVFCLFSVSKLQSVVVFNEELYGILGGNLRMLIIYLGIIEMLVLMCCSAKNNFTLMILVGFYLLLLIESLKIYGDINGIEIDLQLSIVFAYAGFSHVLFGIRAAIAQADNRLQAK